MNISDVFASLLRRWWLTVIGIGLTVALCVLLVRWVGPTYEEKSTVLLLPPVSTLEDGENPYLGLAGLNQMVDVLVRSMSAQSTQLDVAQRWPGSEFTIEPDLQTSGPIILITVRNTTPEDTEALTTYLLSRAPRDLLALQTSLEIRPRSMITSSVISRYTEPDVVRSTELRAGLAAVAAGLATTVIGVGVIDRVLGNRRQNRWQQWLKLSALGAGPDPSPDGSDDSSATDGAPARKEAPPPASTPELRDTSDLVATGRNGPAAP